MAHANLNFPITEKRMLKKLEASAYMGLPVKHFDSVCLVRPIELLLGPKSVKNTVWTFDVKVWLEAETKRNHPSQSAKIVSCLRAEMSNCSQYQSDERSA